MTDGAREWERAKLGTNGEKEGTTTMTHQDNYWTRRRPRREVFGLGGGLAAALLVGACGGDDNKSILDRVAIAEHAR